MIPVCRKILGREPRCPEWITAIGVSIGLSGAAATAAGAAIVGAGLGLAASDITSMVQGNFPWKDPGEFFSAGAKGMALGAAGGAIGGAVGPAVSGAIGSMGGSTTGGMGGVVGGSSSTAPAVGATGGAVGGGSGGAATDALSAVGQGFGTVADKAGAVNPTELSGIVNSTANQVVQQGGQASQGLFQESLGKIVANTTGGAITGGIKDPENFGRGALMGAAGGAASSAFSSGANALFRGQGAGIVPNSADGPNRGFSMMGDSGGDFGRAYNPDTASSGFDNFMDNNQFGYDPGRETFSISRANIATPPPTLASRAMDLGINQGSNMAGRAASRMVGSAMTPTPEDPMSQNPYAQYGRNPYWMRRM